MARATRLRRWSAALALAALVGGVAAASPASASYPGRNGRIAFVRAGDIYTVNANGTGVRRMTYFGNAGEPNWSKDGKRIAFTVAGSVWLMQADGTRQTQIAPGSSPSISPDGGRIALVRFDDPTCETQVAWVSLADPARTPHRLAGAYQCESSFNSFESPTWSTDGKRVLYAGASSHNIRSWFFVSEVDVATGVERSVVGVANSDDDGSACAGGATNPAYGPNSTGVVFVGSDDTFPGPGDCKARLYAVRTNGLDLRQVGTVTNVFDPDRAPDGSASVVFAHKTSTGTHVKVLQDAPGGSVRLVVNNGTQPAWQPLPA